MFGRLGLCFNLKRVVMGLAHIAKEQDRVKWKVVRSDVGCAAGQAAERIAGYGSATRGAVDVEVIAAYQDVAADRAGIASGEQNIARKLALHVGVILMNPAGLVVGRLVVERALECAHILWRGQRGKAGGEVEGPRRCLAAGDGAVGSRKGAARGGELIRLAEVGRILPQALRALAPD